MIQYTLSNEKERVYMGTDYFNPRGHYLIDTHKYHLFLILGGGEYCSMSVELMIKE